MIANRNSEEVYPLTWVGRMPVYLATILAAVQFLSMVITAVLLSIGGPLSLNKLLLPLVFSFDGVVKNLNFWTIASYPFVNPPDIFFFIQLVMFGWFGAEVEKFLGRKSFAWLCGILVVAMPAFLLALGFTGTKLEYFGAGSLNFAVFLAFAMIYPRAQIFFTIEARWIALALMLVFSLQYLASNAWAQLLMLWWGLAVAAAWLKFEGALAYLPTPSVSDYFKRKHSERKLKVVKAEPERPEDGGVYDTIDPILEKIAKQGIGSLSRAEREKLERARTALLNKDRGH